MSETKAAKLAEITRILLEKVMWQRSVRVLAPGGLKSLWPFQHDVMFLPLRSQHSHPSQHNPHG